MSKILFVVCVCLFSLPTSLAGFIARCIRDGWAFGWESARDILRERRGE